MSPLAAMAAPSADVANEIPPELADRVLDPRVVNGLTTLLDHLDVINLLVESVDGFMRHSETILDSVLASAADGRATIESAGEASGLEALRQVDTKRTVDAGAQLLAALPEATPALLRGARSGAIDELTSPALVKVLHLVSVGAERALEDPDPLRLTGVRSVLKLLKDPDTARGIAFFANVARAVGHQLSVAT